MLKPFVVSSKIHHVKKKSMESIANKSSKHLKHFAPSINVQSKFDQKFPGNKNVLKSSRISKHIELRFRDLSPNATSQAGLSASNRSLMIDEPQVTGVSINQSPGKHMMRTKYECSNKQGTNANHFAAAFRYGVDPHLPPNQDLFHRTLRPRSRQQHMQETLKIGSIIGSPIEK